MGTTDSDVQQERETKHGAATLLATTLITRSAIVLPSKKKKQRRQSDKNTANDAVMESTPVRVFLSRLLYDVLLI